MKRAENVQEELEWDDDGKDSGASVMPKLAFRKTFVYRYRLESSTSLEKRKLVARGGGGMGVLALFHTFLYGSGDIGFKITFTLACLAISDYHFYYGLFE